MTSEEFALILHDQLRRITDILGIKATEYATADRLHNFKNAAILQNQTPTQALAGMMAKHTVSLYDMIASGRDFPIDVWDEKITDHLNYLILLRALVDEKSSMTDEYQEIVVSELNRNQVYPTKAPDVESTSYI